MGRIFGLFSLLAAASYHWWWEAVRAWLYERGFHLLNPYLFGIAQEQLWHWGPTLALAGLGISLFWKTRPRIEKERLVIAFEPDHARFGGDYSEVTIHPQTHQPTQLYRISVTSTFQRPTRARLIVEGLTDRSGASLPLPRQTLRNREVAPNGDFDLYHGQMTFFDVAAYYKADPNEVFVCVRDGMRYPSVSAPFTLSILLTGEGLAQRKQYRFGFDPSGEFTFSEILSSLGQ